MISKRRLAETWFDRLTAFVAVVTSNPPSIKHEKG